jgi:hypothetical protein
MSEQERTPAGARSPAWSAAARSAGSGSWHRAGSALFDVRAFQGSVLGSGAVPLGVLDQVVTRWIDEAR